MGSRSGRASKAGRCALFLNAIREIEALVSSGAGVGAAVLSAVGFAAAVVDAEIVGSAAFLVGCTGVAQFFAWCDAFACGGDADLTDGARDAFALVAACRDHGDTELGLAATRAAIALEERIATVCVCGASAAIGQADALA